MCVCQCEFVCVVCVCVCMCVCIYIYIMEYYLAIENEIMPFAAAWMDLESITVSKSGRGR